MKYVSSLDGLRAVAILAVLGFHVFPKALSGGFTGVDVFFVLSGYLITSVILHDVREGTFSFREFYLRRIQRLLPNAVLMLLVTLALYSFILLPSLAVKVAQHGLWVLFSVSNVYTWRNAGGYWADSAASMPLLHTWSLAVEEQFYLLFPLTLSLLWRRASLLTVTACLAIASLALSIFATASHPASTFFLLPTRAWEPLFGAVLATYLIPAHADRRLRSIGPTMAAEVAGWIGLVMIVTGFFVIREGSRYPGVIALVPSIGTLILLVSIANDDTFVARLLAKSPLVLVGKLSYSLYLWHWPMIVIGRTLAELTGRSRQAGGLIGLSVGVAVAVIAYRVVEAPLRKRGPGRKRRLLVLTSALAVAGLACVTVSGRRPIADPDGEFERPAFYGLLYNVAGEPNGPPGSTTRYFDVLMPEPPDWPKAWTSGGIVHHWGAGTPRLVVIGSSHALMFGRLIDDISKQLRIPVAFLSADSTPVFFPTRVSRRFSSRAIAQSFDDARRKWISEWHPDAVIVIDRWDSYATSPDDFNRKLRELVGELAPHTGHVILFSQVPVLGLGQTVNLREYVTWYERTFGRFPMIMPDAAERFRKSTIATFDGLAHDVPQVQLLRVDPPFYKDDGSVRFSSGRRFLYADDNHLSEAGADLLREICMRAISATQRNQVVD